LAKENRAAGFGLRPAKFYRKKKKKKQRKGRQEGDVGRKGKLGGENLGENINRLKKPRKKNH